MTPAPHPQDPATRDAGVATVTAPRPGYACKNCCTSKALGDAGRRVVLVDPPAVMVVGVPLLQRHNSCTSLRGLEWEQNNNHEEMIDINIVIKRRQSPMSIQERHGGSIGIAGGGGGGQTGAQIVP